MTEWEVAPVEIDRAHELVRDFHYAKGASNTAVYLHGLYPVGWHWYSQCVGVAWWIPPTLHAAKATYPSNPGGVLVLSRLAIDPDVPRNACSFLLAGSRRLIDSERWPCLVTYADEWQGHTGAIYRADNWQYAGRTKPERGYVINERMTARKAGGKTRTHAQMLALGAECVGAHAKHKFIRTAA